MPSAMSRWLLVAALALTAALAAGCAAEEEEPTVESGAAAASSADDGSTAAAEGNSTSADTKKAEAAKADAKVGDVMNLKGTAYKVLSAKTAKKVGEDFTEVKADGTFVIVKLTLTNLKDEPATILEDAIHFVGANGKEYSTSSDALLAVEDAFILEEIQPEVEKKVTLVYDVPPKALGPDAVIQVKDLWSDSTGTINLGLKKA